MKVKAVIRLFIDPAQRRSSHCCTGDAKKEITGALGEAQETGAACGFFILQLLALTFKGGWGLLWQPPCWWLRGWRVWEGNLYKSNHSFFFFFWDEWREGGWGGETLRCLWMLAVLRLLRKIHSTPLTPRPSHSWYDSERVIFVICFDGRWLQCFTQLSPWVECQKSFSSVLPVSETNAE